MKKVGSTKDGVVTVTVLGAWYLQFRSHISVLNKKTKTTWGSRDGGPNERIIVQLPSSKFVYRPQVFSSEKCRRLHGAFEICMQWKAKTNILETYVITVTFDSRYYD